jgi:hypothetical protein
MKYKKFKKELIMEKEKFITLATIEKYENGKLFIKRQDQLFKESIGIYKNDNYENKIGKEVELWYRSDGRSFGLFFIKEK